MPLSNEGIDGKQVCTGVAVDVAPGASGGEN